MIDLQDSLAEGVQTGDLQFETHGLVLRQGGGHLLDDLDGLFDTLLIGQTEHADGEVEQVGFHAAFCQGHFLVHDVVLEQFDILNDPRLRDPNGQEGIHPIHEPGNPNLTARGSEDLVDFGLLVPHFAALVLEVLNPMLGNGERLDLSIGQIAPVRKFGERLLYNPHEAIGVADGEMLLAQHWIPLNPPDHVQCSLHGPLLGLQFSLIGSLEKIIMDEHSVNLIMEGSNTTSNLSESIRGVYNYLFPAQAPAIAWDTTKKDDERISDASTIEESPPKSIPSLPENCLFFRRASCTRADKCRFIHSSNGDSDVSIPSQSNKAANQTKLESKKRSMKTALDVIRRIQWDPMLCKEHFSIGYTDRFVGIVEEPFAKFSNWCDLANAEIEALSIPQHRIQYFKYKGSKVWDKKAKVDEVFGSTGSEVGIAGFMDRVDALEEQKPAPSVLAESSDDSDSDEDEDNVNIHLGNKFSTNNVDTVPLEDRSTHFLAIRVTEPGIVQNVKLLQDHIVDQEMALTECCMKTNLLHLTIGMLRLSNEEGIKEAIEVVEEMTSTLAEYKAMGLKLKIAGLDTFGQRVLYGKVQPEPEEAFWTLISTIQNKISQTSPNVVVTNKFEFTPHLTVMKVNRPIARLRHSKYLPSALYEKYQTMDFGVQPVQNLQLCIIEATTRFDGFYQTLREIVV
eukprot:maker-scaffold248_size238799-snap-gene-1.24 protein:Tk02159 transcript:maker-scaffold248_size238799-snap-gene-1.24-mRNA-1 annotation:"hypothetical protein SPRG_11048"